MELQLVILDEPTAALGVAQTEQVLELVRALAEQGLAVVLISHNLHDIFETATRITVLRLGRNVGVYERQDDAAGGRARDHRRNPDEGRRHRRDSAGGRGMSTVDVAAAGLGPPEAEEQEDIWQRASATSSRGTRRPAGRHRRDL